jgi:hypothetical protein
MSKPLVDKVVNKLRIFKKNFCFEAVLLLLECSDVSNSQATGSKQLSDSRLY